MKTPKKKKIKLSKKILFQKIFSICVYYLSFLNIGYALSITGLTLPLLQIKTNVNESTIGILVTFRGIGQLFFSFFCGYIFDMFKIQSDEKNEKQKWYKITMNKIIMGSLIIEAICFFLIPFFKSIVVLCIIEFFIGGFICLNEIGCYVAVDNICGDDLNAESYQQGNILVFGLGNIIFPLIIAQIYSFIDTMKNQLLLSYLICGTLQYLPVLFLLIIPTPKNPPTDINKKEDKDNKKKKKKSCKSLIKTMFNFNVIVNIATFCLKGLSIGNEIGFGSLMFAYGKSKGFGSDSSLSYLTSICFIVYSVVKLLCMVLSNYIKNFYWLLVCLSSTTLCFVLFLIFPNNIIMHWILSIAYFIFQSPLAIAILYFPQNSFGIKLTSTSTSFIMVGQYIGELVCPLMSSLLSDDAILGPNSLLIIGIISNSLSLIIFLAVAILGYFVKKRGNKLKDENSQKTLDLEKVEITNEKLLNTSDTDVEIKETINESSIKVGIKESNDGDLLIQQ